ncbi:MAG: hypothetical protein J0I06_07695 [Planctomycetes bacterium]|nr:hypothetical protein [Planctomycetota bacterium]
MGNRTPVVGAWVLAVLLGAGLPVVSAPPEREELTLQVKTDRKRYDPDDTVLVLAKFDNDPRVEIQFADAAGGAFYFHLIVEPTDGKWDLIYVPVWELQFEEWGRGPVDKPQLWLKGVKTGLTHQLAVHLPRLVELPQGEYKLRIGYALSGGKLKPLVEAATGKKVRIPEGRITGLKGAFEGAVLSEPVTITIGPEKKK